VIYVVVRIQSEEEYYDEVDVYVRVSSDDQQERETIKNQIEFATKYCDLHKLKIRNWYKDDGVTGTIPLEQRPDGQRLLQDAENGLVKNVLIFNMKRLGRKTRITLDAVYQLEKFGVKIKSMTEPFDTGDPVGRFIITVLAGQAELDRDTTLEVMWHGANRAARLGRWLGGIVPYGYRVNHSKFLEINEDPITGREEFSEVSVIRLIYFLITSQKYSTVRIADHLNAFNIPPSYIRDGRQIKKGKRKVNTAGVWSPSRIRNMLVNTTYKGVHTYGQRATRVDRELIERIVPAIVDADIWDLAQIALKDNQLEAMKNSKRQYLLRGLIKCGFCGLSYHGTSFSGPKREPKPYYICGGKTAYRGPLQGKCVSKNVPAEWLENKIWDECVNFINNPETVISEIITDDYKESQTGNLLLELKLAKKSVLEKEESKQSILTLFRKKMISQADVEAQLTAIEKEDLEMRSRIKIIESTIDTNLDNENKIETVGSILSTLKKLLLSPLSFETKREIVKTLVNKATIELDKSNDEGPFKPRVNVLVRYFFQLPRML
jgi:site-specific DNA recombinase